MKQKIKFVEDYGAFRKGQVVSVDNPEPLVAMGVAEYYTPKPRGKKTKVMTPKRSKRGYLTK